MEKLTEKCTVCNGSCIVPIVIPTIHGKVITDYGMCDKCIGRGIVPTSLGKELLSFCKEFYKEFSD